MNTRTHEETIEGLKKTHTIKELGSIGILMRYGEYIAKYPDGRRNDSAHGDSQGYCIISKSDPKNICWITLREFAMFQRMHEIATKNEGAAGRGRETVTFERVLGKEGK